MTILLKLLGILGITLFFAIPSTIFLNRRTIKKLIYRKKLIEKIAPFYDSYKFDTIYEEIITNTNIDEIEKEHKQNFIASLTPIFLCLSVFLPMACVFFIKDDDIISFLTFIGIILMLLCFKNLKLRKFTKYKEIIVQNLFKHIHFNLDYQTDYDIYDVEKFLYQNSNFDKNLDIGIIRVKDYLLHDLNSDTLAELANISVSNKNSRTTPYVFEGIIAQIPQITNNLNHILITSNTKTRKQLNSNNFEEYFCVSSNQESNDFINQHIKEELVTIYEKYKIPFEISVNELFIHVRFFTGPLFETTYSYSFDKNKKKLYEDYILLQSVLEIVTKINDLFNEGN